MGTSAIALGIEIRKTPADADAQVAKLAGLLATFREQAAKAFNTGGAGAQQMATAVNQAIGGFQRMGQTIDVTNTKAVAAFRAEGDALAAYLVKLGATDAELNKIGATIAKVEQQSGAAGVGLFPAVPGATLSSFDRLSPKVRTAANAASILAFSAAGVTKSLSGMAVAAGTLTTGLASLVAGPIGAVAAGIGAVVVVTTTVIELFHQWREEAKKVAQEAREALAKDPRLEQAIETENQLLEIRQRANDAAVVAIIARTRGEDAAHRAGIELQFRREKEAVDRSLGLEITKSAAIVALTKKRDADLAQLEVDRARKATDQAAKLAAEQLELINKRTLTDAQAQRAAAELRFKEEQDRIAKERQQAAGNAPLNAALDTQLAAAARIRAEQLDAINRDEATKQRAAITDANAQLLELTGRGAEARALKIQRAYEDLVEKLKKLGVANADEIARNLFDVETAKGQIDDLEQSISQASDIARSRIAEVEALAQSGALTGAQAQKAIIQALREEQELLARAIPLLEAQAVLLNDEATLAKVAQLRAELAAVGLAIKDAEAAADPFAAALKQAAKDAGAAIESGLVQGLDEATDGVHSFADAWRDAAASVVAALRRIAAQMLATLIIQKALQALQAIFGGGGGGGFSSLLKTGIDTIGGGGTAVAAEGGLIRGPGTATSDSIPARLSDGEYVMRAAVVKQLGVGFFDLLNAAQRSPAPTTLRRFADGGLVAAEDSAVRGGAADRILHLIVDAHPDLVVRALETRPGVGAVLNLAKRNRNAFHAALGE